MLATSRPPPLLSWTFFSPSFSTFVPFAATYLTPFLLAIPSLRGSSGNVPLGITDSAAPELIVILPFPAGTSRPVFATWATGLSSSSTSNTPMPQHISPSLIKAANGFASVRPGGTCEPQIVSRALPSL